MALAELQAVLALLYTDGGFRDEFLSSPESAASKLGITSDEARSLASQCGRDARLFARSLHAKRCKEAATYLPLTVKSLGTERFRRLFFRHADGFLPQGTDKPKADAVAFVRWLVNDQRRNKGVPGDALELARYETSALLATESRGITICLFHLPLEHGGIRTVLSVWIHFASMFKRFDLRIPRFQRSTTHTAPHAS